VDEACEGADQSREGRTALIGYLYLSLALILAAYGNLVLKYYLNRAGYVPTGVAFLGFFLKFFLLTPWGLSCLASAALCVLFWFATISRFDLSYIFPFLSLNFAFVTVMAIVILHEPFTWNKIIGVSLIVIGVIVVSQGA
jgi:drug/metabolite transporter (DMT)-like permease